MVVLPGNPGQAAYYLPLLAHLHEQLGGVADVLAVSHKGHGIDCRCEQVGGRHKAAAIMGCLVVVGTRVCCPPSCPACIHPERKPRVPRRPSHCRSRLSTRWRSSRSFASPRSRGRRASCWSGTPSARTWRCTRRR